MANELFKEARRKHKLGKSSWQELIANYDQALEKCNEEMSNKGDNNCCNCQVSYYKGLVYLKLAKDDAKALRLFNETIDFNGRQNKACGQRIIDAKKQVEKLK